MNILIKRLSVIALCLVAVVSFAAFPQHVVRADDGCPTGQVSGGDGTCVPDPNAVGSNGCPSGEVPGVDGTCDPATSQTSGSSGIQSNGCPAGQTPDNDGLCGGSNYSTTNTGSSNTSNPSYTYGSGNTTTGASTGDNTTLQGLFATLLNILNNYIVPFIFALAFLMFILGIFRYFIQGGADEENRAKGRSFLLWSLLGFAIIISVWGLVNLFVNTFGFNNSSQPAIPTFHTTTTTQ